MTEAHLFIIACFVLFILPGLAATIISEVSDRKRIAKSKETWMHKTNNTPIFRVQDKEVLVEELPEFIEPKGNAKTIEEKIESFQHSEPTKDMEKSLKELLDATAEFQEVNNNPESDVLDFHYFNEEPNFVDMGEYAPYLSDDNISPLDVTNEEDFSIETTESPLGENYVFVWKEFGSKVANMVTASPDFGLDTTSTYVMIGKINGEIFDSFGEQIKLIGLPDDFKETDEFILIQGSFVTAEKFMVIETISAKGASKGEEGFEVLNIAYS